MPTPASTLPIQVSGASAGPAPSRQGANGKQDGAPFSQALNREIEHRASQAPAKPQAAPKNEGPKPKPAEADKAPAPQQAQAATKADAKAEGRDTSSADAEQAAAQASDAAATAEAAKELPMADMLALVASFNPAVQAATSAAATPASELPAVDAALAPAGAAMVDAAATSFGPDVTGLEMPGEAVKLDLAGATARQAGDVPAAPAPQANPAAMAAVAGEGNGAQHVDGKIVLPEASRQLQPGDAAETAPLGRPAQAEAAPRAPAEAAPFVLPRSVERVEAPTVKDVAAATAPLAAPVQQAALNAAQPAVGGADKIAARVGTPGWDNQVGQKIIWMVAGKEQSASLTLNPPDLGPMQVVLSVNNDQATVTFSSAQPEVRQALENAMPRLREMMGENGIALGNATVNAGMPDQRQAQDGQPRQAPGATGARGVEPSNGSAAEAAARQAARPASGANGLVDTFA